MPRLFFLVFLLWAAVCAASPPTPCHLDGLSPDDRAEYVARWWEWTQRADRSPRGTAPERRIKQFNLNFRGPGEAHYMETADPTRPFEVEVGGKPRLMVYGSGRFAFDIRDANLDNLLRGGIQGRSRVPIQLFFPDGRQMRAPYHTGSLPWDLIAAKWPVDMLDAGDPRRRALEARGEKFVYVGYGGTMVQPYLFAGGKPGDAKLPRQVPGANHNPSRTRHAFDIELADGKQVWRDRGSVFGHRPSTALEWLGEDHEHGYGGRPVTNRDGSIYRDAHGKGWMMYERITVEEVVFENGTRALQRKGADGKLTITVDGRAVEKLPDGKIKERIPKVTEMFARRMKNPYEAFAKGDPLFGEELVLSVHPDGDVTKLPYPATSRGEGAGFLAEGFNHTEVTIDGKDFHVISGSTGNFVDGNVGGRGYGAMIAFRDDGAGPIGRYEPVLSNGDMANFTTEIGRKYGIVWGPGRPDLFRDARGEWWMICHGVPQHTLREGLPRGGWPRSPEEFNQYYRAGFVMPVKWRLRDGKPWLEVEDPAMPR